ncbi:molybdopterin molybdotransferase MoeA, partial [Campylobacter jejuni]|nr:molybdopterin molybdotransferase MoeA [Campylobacter jejuni]
MKNIFKTLKDLENQISCLDESELISLEKAKDRILAKDLYARKNLPSFDNAALDGYAFNYTDINEALEIKGTIFAGDKNFYTVAKNECYKIMTGAKMPKNADTILMLEDEYIEENKLIIKKAPKQYNAYRYKGEELKKGEILLQKGTKLNDKHIALLASQGLYKIEVIRKIRIGIFSSGNELKEPWQECDEESIYNANALP